MSENDEVMSVGQASKYIGKTVHTLQDWDRKRKFIAHRNPINNRRFYYKSELDKLLGKYTVVQPNRKIVAYARVSSAGQKDNLKDQKRSR